MHKSNFQFSIFPPASAMLKALRAGNFQKKLFIVLIIGYWLLNITSQVHAQQSTLGLAISPPLDVVELHGSEPIVLAFTIENLSAIDLNVTPQIRSFHADNQTGAVVLDDLHPINYVTIQTSGITLGEPFVLAANQKQQIVLHITPPANLGRDLTLTLLAAGKPIKDQGLMVSNTAAEVTNVIGANMILRMSGTPQNDMLSLEELHTSTFLDVFSNLNMNLLVRNSDKTTHQMQGTVDLKRGDLTVASFNISSDFVLPDSTRILRAEGPKTASISGPFLPWKYKLEINLKDELGSLHTYSRDVYILPISILSIAFTIAVLASIFKAVFKARSKTIAD